jgi:hypothetical protein
VHAERALAMALDEAAIETDRTAFLRAPRPRVGGALVRAGLRLQGVTATGAAANPLPAGSTGASG